MTGLELILSAICFNSTVCEESEEMQSKVHFRTQKSEEFEELAKELNGIHLKIGTIENPPLSYTEQINDTFIGKGIAFEIVSSMAEVFNFTYEVVKPSNNYEGGIGHLDGTLLGLVNSSEVDLAAAFLPLIWEALPIVDFSTSLDEGVWVMMMTRPKASAVGSGILAPFNSDVWYLTLVALLAYGPCIWFITTTRYRMKRKNRWIEKDKPLGMSKCVWFTYGAFMKQGTTLEPEANPTRILFASWWLFAILITSFYTANLTAFLTLSKFSLEVNDPKDLYSKNYKWLAKDGSAVEYIVGDVNEELHYLSSMVAKGLGTFTQLDDDALLKRIKAGEVFINTQPAVDILMYDDYLKKTRAGILEENRCTFVVSPKPFLRKQRAFAYPKESKLKKPFDFVIESLQASGLIDFLKTNNLPRAKICPLDLQSRERKLKNSDLLTTYMLCIVGTSAGIATFIIELFLTRYKLGKQKQSKRKRSSGAIRAHKKGDDSKPPPYESIFQVSRYNEELKKKKYINGRIYWVVETSEGDVRLIPIRTPSALLFESVKESKKRGFFN